MRPKDVHPKLWESSSWKGRLLMLVYRARWIPSRWRWNLFVWRVNRTEGDRWSYR